MTLKRRIAKLEHQLGQQPCNCPNNTDLSWPGHNPNHTCTTCGGQRIIYPLPHCPRNTEPDLRAVLPILAKTYNGNTKADLRALTDQELTQLSAALAAFEAAGF
jgi:hypothetical protein